MTLVSEIFTDTFTMLNIVATPEQKDNAFKNASREFFSYVSPIIFISNTRWEEIIEAEEVGCNFIDDDDSLNLNIGSFKIIEIAQMNDCVGIRVKPLDYDDFKLDDGYIGAYQFVAGFFLRKVERDNMRMMKSAGIDDGEGFQEEDIQAVRDYLRKEFGITAVGLVM